MTRARASISSPSSDDPSVTAAPGPAADPAAEWQELFGTPAPGRLDQLVARAVAWKRQLDQHGDVSRAVREDLRLVARDALDDRLRRSGEEPRRQDASVARGNSSLPEPVPAPPPAPRRRRHVPTAPPPTASSALVAGTRLVKHHGGRTHVAEVVDGGVLYEGTIYASLSAVAKAITGTHWNGLLFFGLRRRKTYPKKGTAA